MSLAVDIVLWSFAFLTAIWLVYAWWLIQGWKHVFRPDQDFKAQEGESVSIVIPARNEANVLPHLINNLRDQLRTDPTVEVIVVDDHSTDESQQALAPLQEAWDRVQVIPNKGEGKKKALETGIAAAQNEWIITLDADVRLHFGWFKKLKPMLDVGLQMIILPIKFKAKGFLQSLFSLEFLSLAGSTGAIAANGHPFLCNGAFLAFRKSAYEAVGGYAAHTHLASGDDVFLLHQIRKKFPEQVIYLFDEALIAETDSPSTISDFFGQRIRWASKAGAYRNPIAIFTSWLVFLHQLSLLTGLAFICFSEWLWMPLLVCFTAKILIDFLFLLLLARSFGQLALLRVYIPVALLYPIYVVMTALAALVYQPKWKERKGNPGS